MRTIISLYPRDKMTVEPYQAYSDAAIKGGFVSIRNPTRSVDIALHFDSPDQAIAFAQSITAGMEAPEPTAEEIEAAAELAEARRTPEQAGMPW